MLQAQPRVRALRSAILLAFALGASGALPAQEPARKTLTDAQKERFLLDATIVSRRGEPRGGTGTDRALLALDGLEHEAHVQEVEGYDLKVEVTGGSEIDLRDSWRYNVAAYRLDRLLGLGMVPVTVERRDSLKEGSFTWWVDDYLMDEKTRVKRKASSTDAAAWEGQLQAVRIFDQLIYNSGRDGGNLLIDGDWRIWIMEHSRAFKPFEKLKAPRSLGERCPRALLAALRRLDRPAIERAMVGILDGRQVDGLLARRDAIVRHFDERIATSGEAVVLYDLPPRS
jgi:hypothetical protein